MKKLSLALSILLISLSCLSQNKQVLYNYTSIPQSILSNPGADIKYRAFLGFPLVSGISANLGSDFSVNDLFANNGVDFNDKLRNLVFSSSRNDKILFNEQLEVLSAGFKLGKSFFSFGIYQELDALVYMPKDYAVLLLDGNKNHIGKTFNLGDLNGRAELISVFHLGYQKKINEDLTLGARAKIYSSIFNVSSTSNSGYFYTNQAVNLISPQPTQATNYVYDQEFGADILVNTSGLKNYTDKNSTTDITNDIINKTLLGGNLGFGLDLGLTYYIRENLQFTASLIDIGFIKHTKETQSYTLKGSYKYVGMNPDWITGSSSNVIDELRENIPLDTLYGSYTTWRPLKLNSSIEYSFGKFKRPDCNCEEEHETRYPNLVGAHLFVMNAPRSPLFAFTTYYKRYLLKSLELKATYTLDSFSVRNIGLGLSTKLANFHFYILADNLLEFKDVSKANSFAFQTGINFVFPTKK